jgi:hypothetical protein
MGPGPTYAEAQEGPDGRGRGQEQNVDSRQSVWKEMEEVVKGRLVELDQLDREDHPDWARVDKVGLGLGPAFGLQQDRVGLGLASVHLSRTWTWGRNGMGWGGHGFHLAAGA